MAQVNNTPASYWLSLPLSQLGGWIEDSNFIQQKIKEAHERM
jgi:hypothetical protein